MNYYQQQLRKIRDNHLPPDYIYVRIRQSKNFMDMYFDQSIDLNDIATSAHFSKFHFVRLFKTTYGRTPHQYLRDLRIKKAKKLLSEPTLVSSVCYRVGYDSPSTFSRLFKKATGLSPIMYQQAQKQF